MAEPAHADADSIDEESATRGENMVRSDHVDERSPGVLYAAHPAGARPSRAPIRVRQRAIRSQVTAPSLRPALETS